MQLKHVYQRITINDDTHPHRTHHLSNPHANHPEPCPQPRRTHPRLKRAPSPHPNLEQPTPHRPTLRVHPRPPQRIPRQHPRRPKRRHCLGYLLPQPTAPRSSTRSRRRPPRKHPAHPGHSHRRQPYRVHARGDPHRHATNSYHHLRENPTLSRRAHFGRKFPSALRSGTGYAHLRGAQERALICIRPRVQDRPPRRT